MPQTGAGGAGAGSAAGGEAASSHGHGGGLHSFDGPRAILVSDMSGFTRITRKMGIIHMASLILKMRQLSIPILQHYNCTSLQTHADNCAAVFASVEQAVAAAKCMVRAIREYNAKQFNRDWTVTVSGIAVGYGDGIQTDGHKVFGPAAADTFYLGEDQAEGTCILLTADAKAQLDEEVGWQHATCHRESSLGGEPTTIEYFEMDASTAAATAPQLQLTGSYTVSHERGQAFLDLAMRRLEDYQTNTGSPTSTEAKLKKGFAVFKAALMLGCAEEDEACLRSHGVAAMVARDQRRQRIVAPIVKKHAGSVEEPTLFFFDDVNSALRAALAIQRALRAQHEIEAGQSVAGGAVMVDCLGLHCGEVLFVPGTDIHWGDPVNTASKLAEDLGKPGQLLVSAAAFAKVQEAEWVKARLGDGSLKAESSEMVVSKVKLQVYDVQQSYPAAAPALPPTPLIAAPSAGMETLPGKHAILVSDMSGFTRITRKRGIIHMASLIVTMRQLVVPCMKANGSTFISFHADNCLAMFPEPLAAVRAAQQALARVAAFNESAHHDDWRIAISGFAVSYGDGVYKLGHDLHGEPVQDSFFLGEEVCEGGNLVATVEACIQLRKQDTSKSLSMLPRVINHPGAPDSDSDGDGVEDMEYFVVQGEPTAPPAAADDGSSAYTVDSEAGQEFLTIAAKSMREPDKAAAFTSAIKARFVGHRAALMIASTAGDEAAARAEGMQELVRRRRARSVMVNAAARQHGGEAVEPTLLLFPSVAAAVAAAITIQRAMAASANPVMAVSPASSRLLAEVASIPVDCCAVHCGDLLVVPGTDIHWGDPVNTASKLAEDLGKVGELLISDAAMKSLRAGGSSSAAVLQGLRLEQREEKVSGVPLVHHATRVVKLPALAASKQAAGKAAAQAKADGSRAAKAATSKAKAEGSRAAKAAKAQGSQAKASAMREVSAAQSSAEAATAAAAESKVQYTSVDASWRKVVPSPTKKQFSVGANGALLVNEASPEPRQVVARSTVQQYKPEPPVMVKQRGGCCTIM